MINLFPRKRQTKSLPYRTNRWKGLRASQSDDARQQACRSRGMDLLRRVARRVLLAAGIAGMLLAGMAAMRELQPILQRGLEIRDIQIVGVHQVTKQEIVDRLALKNGIALHQVSLSYLADRLRSIVWIKEATLERLPLHTLRITVIERTPAAIAGIGPEHYLTDDEGVVLARLGAQDEPALPLLTGMEIKPLLQGEMRLRRLVQSAVELAKAMAHSVDGRVEIDLSTAPHLVASVRGLRFQFGEEPLLDQWRRFQLVKAAFRTGVWEGRKHEGGEVDLRYGNRVIVRERG